MRTVTSTLASFRWFATLGVSLLLAACGSSQNWDDDKPNVTIGGTVSGFTGGTLALWNNGGDKLRITGNGKFEFPLQIANGSDYAVVVATQPAGQTCTVANGSGTADGNVKDVSVTCVPYTFTRRPLPAIYSTGKAVNYSPYRTEGGPITLEVPSDAEILQDLTLLDLAGFDLLRLFGARAPATDVVAEKILRIAAENFPNMKFQLGVELKGLTSCSQTDNDYNIAYLISNLSKYPNVVTISVGNETSFFSRYMPLPCLESYIRTIRSQVTQPVTADDDWTFYAGKSTFETSERVPVKPDTILALIDFASIHMYPFSYTVWDWQQTSVPAGPARAEAMMEQSLVALKEWYGEVVNYQYVGADGVTVSVGDSMPITVGETGWKARQTNPAAEIETYAAREENAKWYVDLLYGNPGGYPAWQGSADGPPMIFYFEAFDETWKGIDDGWGLWDITRQARYALCGLPAGQACNDDLYAGAGYYDPPPFSTVTFDSPTITYALVGFGGAEDSQVVTDPTGGTNRVARVNRAATAEVFAGTIVGTSGQTVGTIPFDAANTRMTVRVYSPAAGIPVRLKVEDSTNSARSVETEAVTTVANAWETLTFDFANPVSGPPLNLDYDYNKLIIFFNFGATGAAAGAQTYYFDDITFIGGGGLPVGDFSDLSFDSPGVVYTLTGFGGAEDSSLQPDPTNGTNTVVRVNRSATAQTFAGTIVSTGPNLTVGTIPFSTTSTRMTVRVYSPAAGIRVLLKIEDSADPANRFSETEAFTTVANAWETLTFDFANGTPALNLGYNYNRLIIFFNFGVEGATAGAQTFYFDDVLFVTGGGGGGPIVFASGYASNNRTVEGGEWGFYSGNFTNYTNTYAGGAFVDDNPAVPAADTYIYLVVATSAPTTDGFMGIFTGAPGYTIAAPNAGVTLSGQTSLRIELGMAAEWFQQPNNKALTVRLVGAQVYTDGLGNRCQILIDTPLTPTTADLTLYTITLGSMSLAQGCDGGGFGSGVTTLAQALAQPIGEVHVQAVFPQVNTTVTNGAGTEYPTGFTRGSVTFE
jgi:exo-beta-1,3-glucanase (GH17 family)